MEIASLTLGRSFAHVENGRQSIGQTDAHTVIGRQSIGQTDAHTVIGSLTLGRSFAHVEKAYSRYAGEKVMFVVPGASHIKTYYEPTSVSMMNGTGVI